MKRRLLRLAFISCVLMIMVAGLAIQARPNPFPGDDIPCPTKPPCTSACDPSRYTSGYCTAGGHSFITTYDCCCCVEKPQNRTWHGG